MPLFSPLLIIKSIICIIIILQLSGSLEKKAFRVGVARWVGFCQSRCGKAHFSYAKVIAILGTEPY